VSQTGLQRRGRGDGVADESHRRGCRRSLGEEGRDRSMGVEISGVTMCPSDDLITAAYLDYPRTGPVDGYAFDAYGWVLCKAPVAEVEFVHEQSVLASCELTVSRPDVAEVYGSSSSPVGFSKAVGTVGLAPDFTVGVRVVFQDGRRREIEEYAASNQDNGGRAQCTTSTMQPTPSACSVCHTLTSLPRCTHI
jgi:hypothetical protein